MNPVELWAPFLPTEFPIGSEVGLALLSPTYHYLYINTNLAAQNGATRQAHFMRTVREMLPQAWPIIRPLLDRARDTRTPVTDVGLLWTNALGEQRRALLTYTAIFSRDTHEHLGWLALVRPEPDDPLARVSYLGEAAAHSAASLIAAVRYAERTLRPTLGESDTGHLLGNPDHVRGDEPTGGGGP